MLLFKKQIKVFCPLSEEDLERGYKYWPSSSVDQSVLMYTNVNKLKAYLQEQELMGHYPYYTRFYLPRGKVETFSGDGRVLIQLPFCVYLEDKIIKRI